MRQNILVDIDHTLSNSFWRDPMIGTVTWDEYHAASWEDEPLQDVVDMINVLSMSYNIVGFTARPEKWRKLSMEWLVKNKVAMHELLMRPDDNFHPAPEIKLSLVKGRFADPSQEVAFIIDDREDVVAAFRALGITAFRVFGRRQ